MEIDSASEEVDPLASSGISVSSFEDDGTGLKSRRKSKSTLSRLRKLKKPETNGPIGNFTPHPPEKSAWDSPRPLPNGVNHSSDPEEVDPFTGEVKKSRKKKDPFTSTADESPSPTKDDDDDDFEEKTDPFTGQVVKTKKKRDPFTLDTSEDFESEPVKEDEPSAPDRTKKDPFTAMNSIDFGNPAQDDEEAESPGDVPRTSNIKRDPFVAMNSIDFNGTRDEDHTPDPDQDRSPMQRDPFTAMNSIDCGSPSKDDAPDNLVESTISVEDEQVFDPAADDETGEQNEVTKERRLTPDGSDHVGGVITAFEEPKVESSPSAEVHLSDGNELLKSSNTDLEETETSLPPNQGRRSLSPLQEQYSQEQSSQSNTDNNETGDHIPQDDDESLPEPERPLVDEYGERIVENGETYRVGGRKDTHIVTAEIHATDTHTEIEASKPEVLEIDEESDSDDLVVMPGMNKKPPETNAAKLAMETKNDDELLPVATSTPAREDEVPSRSGVDAPIVPPLNLEGVVHSDDETNDGPVQDKTPSAAKSVDSGHEDSDSGSELEEMDTLKASTFVVAQNCGDSECEIIVRRKSRTKNIPDIVASPDSKSGGEGSSNVIKKGRLSPIMPRKQPPPLEDNFSSLVVVLRTCYKKDNLTSSMVLSEPVMRSTEELSDTNRSYLSTSALPQISTKKTRDRSFLSGGVRNSGSLLGKDELERFFPDRKLRIFMATWNMCEIKVLPDNLEDLLLPEHTEFDILHDMYVIGTQESSPDGFEWEVAIQDTLGPSHVLLHSATHGVLRLLIFLRRDLIWFCSPVEEDRVSTRPFSMIKTKGAVAASFTFFGTSLLFINAHFTSGDEKMDDRLQDYEKILKGVQLPVKVVPNKRFGLLTTDVTTRFDCVFWCGDFNFRISESRKKVENWANDLRNGTKSDYNILLQHDQLRKAMNKNEIFRGFKEGAIEFIPTYKFDIDDDTYDTSEKKRVPSYTDRILIKSRKKSDIAILHYMSVDDIKASDHRPVSGVFEVNIRPGKEDMALGGGQFSRDVFIEGNRRRAIRASDKTHTQKDSSVCAVM